MNGPCSPPSRFRLVSRLSRLLPPVESGTSAPLRWVIDVPHLHRAERLAFSSINAAQAKLRVWHGTGVADTRPKIIPGFCSPAPDRRGWGIRHPQVFGTHRYSTPTDIRHAQIFGQCHV